MLEIERQFLMSGFPTDLELLHEVEIEQGYVSIEPEVRIHRAMDKSTGENEFWLTLKSDGDISRTELKTKIDETFYKETVKFIQVPMIKKDYKSYRFGAWMLETACVDADTPNAFYYGEIEFPTAEEAMAFEVPEFFGKEVTFDNSYKMKNYWKKTRLKIRME